jgi:hypothetical protein
MFVIYGTRAYFRRNQVTTFNFCEYCSVHGKLSSFDGRNFFHLYFIPLIPLGSRKRNHQSCPRCNAVQDFDLPHFEQVRQNVKQDTAECLGAILADERTCMIEADDHGGEIEVDALRHMHATQPWLRSAGDNDFIKECLSKLKDPRHSYQNYILHAQLAAISGDRLGAIAQYSQATINRPDDPFAYEQLAILYPLDKQYAKAEENWKKAMQLIPENERYRCWFGLVEALMQQSKFEEAVDIYQRIFAWNPNLGNDPKLKAGFKKAQKKVVKKKQ